jgi:hypothetical protein
MPQYLSARKVMMACLVMVFGLLVGCSRGTATSIGASIPNSSNPTPTITESLTKALSSYSRDLASGTVSQDTLYSSAMRRLLQERRHFYNEFFSLALHSDLLSLSSSFRIRSITEDARLQGTYHIKAVELIETHARYRLEPGGHPLINAANWAIAHTRDAAVIEELEQYRAMYSTSLQRTSTDGYDTDLVVEHDMIITRAGADFQIQEDSYTDANPQDNPGGTDVIEWQDGAFTRTTPDYAGYPDYSIYHTSVEDLGRSLLNDYSR